MEASTSVVPKTGPCRGRNCGKNENAKTAAFGLAAIVTREARNAAAGVRPDGSRRAKAAPNSASPSWRRALRHADTPRYTSTTAPTTCRPRYSHRLARSSPVRPAPAASAQQKTPISLPATAASPAARPSRTVRCRNSAVDGPGSAATARQASKNAGSTVSTCRKISPTRRLDPSPAAHAKHFAGAESALQELAGHDHALDLVGALVDLGDR